MSVVEISAAKALETADWITSIEPTSVSVVEISAANALETAD